MANWLAVYQARELLLGRGLGLLGVWALANLIGSGYQLPRTDRREARRTARADAARKDRLKSHAAAGEGAENTKGPFPGQGGGL